jgi:hypothetical protein
VGNALRKTGGRIMNNKGFWRERTRIHHGEARQRKSIAKGYMIKPIIYLIDSLY